MNDDNAIDKELERYLAGEMSGEERDAFEASLDEALEAQVFDPEVRPLLDAARSLPKTIEPSRDLWQDVAAQLKARPGAGASGHWQHGLRWLAAAGVVIAVAVGVIYGRPDAETGSVAGNDSRPPLQEVMDWEQDFDAAEASYREARAALFAELDARDVPLSDETREILEKNVAVIDTAVREIRAAVAEDPANPRLMQMLAATRERELDFLEILVRVPAGS